MIDGRKTKEFFLGAGRVYADPPIIDFRFIAFMGYAQIGSGFGVTVPSFLPFDVRIKKVTYTSVFANANEHSFALYTHLGFPIIQLPTQILRTGSFTNAIVDDLDILVPESDGIVFGIFNPIAGAGLFSAYCSVLLERDFG